MYLTYSTFDQLKSKIISMAFTQVSEVGNSIRMDKMGFVKLLSELIEKRLNIEQIITDRHTGIRKHMREKKNLFLNNSMCGIFVKVSGKS